MARHSILQTFYASRVWRDFRLMLIADRGPKCQHCGRLVADPKELIGHHKIELTPENVQDASIALNPDLVLLICHHPCHNQMHNRFGARRDRKVYLVYGPPLAGKKTFVSQQMLRGDLVVDMDRLYEAVSFQPAYDKPNNLLSNVFGIHNLLIDNIKTRMGKWGNAWVVGGYAEKFKRERTANDLGAEMVFIEASKEECLARIETNPNFLPVAHEWREYVNKWFDKYQQ